MANYQPERSFIDADGNEFVFGGRSNNGFDWDRSGTDDAISINVFTADTPGADGDYEEDIATVAARSFTLKGSIYIASDPLALQAAMDALATGLPYDRRGYLHRRIVDYTTNTVVSDRRIECRVSGLGIGSDIGLPYRPWEVNFRARRPFYENNALETAVALSYGTAGGTNTNLTPGGVVTVQPLWTFTSTNSGTLTVTESARGKSFTLAIPAAGTYIVDTSVAPRTVTQGGADALSILSGELFELVPTAHHITLVRGGSLALSAASVQYRKRFPFI